MIELTQEQKNIIAKAIKLIEDESQWTQGRYALNADGSSVRPNDPRACSWCATGALLKSINGSTLFALNEYRFPGEIFNELIDVNDEQGHEAVLTFMRDLVN